ncbi:MAG: hypothetical protein HXX10_12860 [Rhodoplanes sp.]|uniref:hypothetical protein n=1 Tax=Rhodoplanes sp. TaxID=1968906 RepID=UPI0017E57854|nr:hypothetical protein [Rhodoplanes sp.]NVO14918.1 hypothetical protein [Rhodoplanes sp.]
MRLTRLVPAAAVLAAVLVAAVPAAAADFRIQDVADITKVAPGSLPPGTIAFADHRTDDLADPKTGLIRFSDWAHARPLQKQLLALYPGYEEPSVTTTVNGVAKTQKRKLHMYVADARFELARPAASLDLARFATLATLEKMDPAIKHRLIGPNDVIPNKDAKLSGHNPTRRWCENATTVICIQSRYQFEGKLPAAIMLLNKLRDSGKQVADHIEFQSELRIVPPAEIDQAAFAKLTGVDTPVAAALEQTIVHVNQIMQFGKVLAVVQPSPVDPGRTIASTFVALAVESDLFEKRKELEGVPVLRNMVPAQVLAGNSSFNTGTSISAGLPSYSRNRIEAIAAALSAR